MRLLEKSNTITVLDSIKESTKEPVKVMLYDKWEEYPSVEEAKAEMLDAMSFCDPGSHEYSRYAFVLQQLMQGATTCYDDIDEMPDEIEESTKPVPKIKVITDIEWETDGDQEALRHLPKYVKMPEDINADKVADYLSDEYGWLVNSCDVKWVTEDEYNKLEESVKLKESDTYTGKELDDTANWVYNNINRDSEWDKFTDDELVELISFCCITDKNPGGRAYDDEVFDAANRRPNGEELIKKGQLMAVGGDTSKLKESENTLYYSIQDANNKGFYVKSNKNYGDVSDKNTLFKLLDDLEKRGFIDLDKKEDLEFANLSLARDEDEVNFFVKHGIDCYDLTKPLKESLDYDCNEPNTMDTVRKHVESGIGGSILVNTYIDGEPANDPPTKDDIGKVEYDLRVWNDGTATFEGYTVEEVDDDEKGQYDNDVKWVAFDWYTPDTEDFDINFTDEEVDKWARAKVKGLNESLKEGTTIDVKYIGKDDWDRHIVKDPKTGRFYGDINLTTVGKDKDLSHASWHTYSGNDPYDGEPDMPVKDDIKFNIINPEAIPSDYQRFEYNLLSRLESDCKYFLGNGNGFEGHLWAGSVDKQIAKMRELYNQLEEKPDWITMEDIDNYEKRMKEYESNKGEE